MSGTKATFLYFAYGSNLLTKRIHFQNPSAVFKDVAKLEGHKLEFRLPSKVNHYLGCSFPVKCRFVYAAWLALLRLPYQRCWQKLRKQTDISQESYSPDVVTSLTLT